MENEPVTAPCGCRVLITPVGFPRGHKQDDGEPVHLESLRVWPCAEHEAKTEAVSA